MLRFTMLHDRMPGWATDSWKITALLGAFLVFFAITILVMPEILAFMFATVLLWGGGMLIAFAWRLRKAQKQVRTNTTVWYY